MTYAFICFYVLFTAYCFLVAFSGKQVEQLIIGLIEKKTGLDIELLAYTANSTPGTASKAVLATIKTLVFLHGVMAVLLVIGVVIELL